MPVHPKSFDPRLFFKKRSYYHEKCEIHSMWKLHTGPRSCLPTPQPHSLLHHQHPLSKDNGPFIPNDEPAGLHLHLHSSPFTFEFIPGVIYTVDLDTETITTLHWVASWTECPPPHTYSLFLLLRSLFHLHNAEIKNVQNFL